MWEKIKSFFIIMHKSSLTPEQERRNSHILLIAEAFVLVLQLYIFFLEFDPNNFSINFRFFSFIIIYVIGLVITLATKKILIPSILFNIAFVLAFTSTFMFGLCDFFGALWMIVVPSLAMYLMNIAVSFWSCLAYSIIVTFLTFYPPTREMLLVRYSPVFLSRYYIVYDIDFLLSTIAMMQLHFMRYNQLRKKENLENAVREERENVSFISMQTIIAINNAVQAKDMYTGQHSQRVALFSTLIAEKMGWPVDAIEELKTIALLHDIGKIGVDEDILNKPSRLTDEEYAQMKQHTTMGGLILKDLTLIPNVDSGAMFHHERYDGKGYPEGLEGEDIPIEARIIGVADAFDAMNFSRVYRPQCDLEYVKNELAKGRGTQFDPEVLDCFLQVCEEKNWFRDLKL